MNLLNEEELKQLDEFIDNTNLIPLQSVAGYIALPVEDVIWLVTKLKEINELLVVADAEITRINKTYNWPRHS